MSSEDEENIAKEDEKLKKKTKFSIQKIKNIKKLEEKEVFSYIENVHAFLKSKEKKLKKYKEKIKKLVKKVEQLKKQQKATKNEALEAAAVIKDDEGSSSMEKKANVVEDKETTPVPLSLVDEIRQAAEQAQNLNGFVYEPTSGLYYDQKTGYYYNAEYGLYYDGNTGCYYKYHQEKNEFEFHSQVPVTEAATTKATDDDIFDNYVNNALLYRFTKLNIDQMRRNALGKLLGQNTVVADDNNEEWGVISERRKVKKRTPQPSTPTPTPTKKIRRLKRKRRQRQHQTDSQTDSSGTDNSRSCSEKKNGVIKTKSKHNDDDDDEDMEDGQLNSSSSDDDDDNHKDSSFSNSASDAEKEAIKIFDRGSHFQDIAKKYPPSLRIIVQETQLEELKVGNLSLITFKGGTLGREGKHDVIIPDVNVSKFHLKFIYDTKRYIYKCIDLGSRNGTILNGTRMCTSKMESEPHDLVHGSILQLGQTKLLCHVHKGNSTCGQCEPGLLIEAASKESTAAAVVLSHKEQLKKIQKKYGLENEKFVENNQGVGNYNDRAATRRIKVGSSTDKEKTQTASVNTAISSENKGFKMLSKLGWSKGEALGKTSAGSGALLEPINVSSNAGKQGLGCEENAPPVLSTAAKTKLANLKKTQERYRKADIFQDSDDSS